MNKKLLLLLASTVLAAGCPFDLSVEGKVIQHNNGAIIRQLPRDNTLELLNIERQYSRPEQRFEKQIRLIKYYEKKLDYERSDVLFDDLIGMVKEANDDEYHAFIDRLNYWAKETTIFQPNSSRFYYRFYLWEKNFGSLDAAIQNLKKAIEIEKTNPKYHYEYAQYVLTNNEYEKGIRMLVSLKSQYPRNVEYRLALAKAYTQAGAYKDAIREYRVASAFEPDNNDTIIAINELTDYTKMASIEKADKNKPFYDPMTAVRPLSAPNGQKLVAYGSKNDVSLNPAQKATNDAASRKVNSNRDANNESAAVINNPYSYVSGNQVEHSDDNASSEVPAVMQSQNESKKVNSPSSRRVMVSYVNGRKVVKIVNINTEVDSSNSLRDASSTFKNQLEDSNSGYGDYNEQNSEKPEYSSYNSSNSSETSSVQANSKESTIGSFNNRSGKNQLLVTYKNGRKVVQLANQEGSPLQASSQPAKKSTNKEKAASIASSDNTDFYVKAAEFASQKEFSQAINVLQQVQPATLRSLTAIASCYNDMGKVDEAIEYYKKADEVSPNNTQILYSIGYLYFTKNDIPTAKEYVSKALELNPSNEYAIKLNAFLSQQDSNVATNQAVQFMNEGNYNEAKKILIKSVKDNPADFQSYYYLGHVEYATQKYEDSAKSFEQAIRYNPEYALSYYSVGLAYDKLKDFNKSLAAYQQFVNIEADDNKYTQYAKTRISTIRAKQ